MTNDEKLAKCVEFIKKIERFDKKNYDTFDIDDTKPEHVYCDNCDEEIEVKRIWPANAAENTEYIDYKVIDDLSDSAWHLLADIEML